MMMGLGYGYGVCVWWVIFSFLGGGQMRQSTSRYVHINSSLQMKSPDSRSC